MGYKHRPEQCFNVAARINIVRVTNTDLALVGLFAIMTTNPVLALAQSYSGPRTGIVDNTGTQIFSPGHPGAVTVSSGITVSGAISVANTQTSGVPVVSSITSLGTSSGAMFAATSNGVYRSYLSITNGNALGGANVLCTDDGSTPSSTNFSFIVYPQAATTFIGQGFIPSTAINCACANGSCPVKGEAFP